MKANMLPTMPMDLRKFNWHKNILTACESDFGPLREGRWWLGRLYKDAADVGITIVSHHTGQEQRFFLSRREEKDGDLIALHFEPESKRSRVREVVIYND